jgi:hypothetical protein
MPLQYSCFISYRHTKQEKIVRELVTSLKAELSLWLDMDVFLDEERLKGGDFFNPSLAQALCESVCLIVVYTPNYFSGQKTYCAREYRAMEELEQIRFKKLGTVENPKHGLIIPLVYRGNKSLPEVVRSKRQCYSFQDFQIYGKDNLENPEYAAKIMEIAEYISDRCEELRVVEDEICSCCDTFEIPSDEAISKWLEDILPSQQKLPSREKTE